MAMTETANRKGFELNHLLHPARAFRTPMDVVADPDMTVQEKRAILASWASDACAVKAAPDLRRPPSASLVRFDDVMDALKRPETSPTNPNTASSSIAPGAGRTFTKLGPAAARSSSVEPRMRKSVIAVALAAVLWTPEASGQTIVQKTDWRAKPYETYLRPPISVPGVDGDIRTKPPRRHLPTDWQAPGLLSFQ